MVSRQNFVLSLKLLMYRKLKAVSIDSLNTVLADYDLCKNPSADLDDLVSSCHKTLNTVLNI